MDVAKYIVRHFQIASGMYFHESVSITPRPLMLLPTCLQQLDIIRPLLTSWLSVRFDHGRYNTYGHCDQGGFHGENGHHDRGEGQDTS